MGVTSEGPPLRAMKAHFRRFFEADPARLHFAAHSHHPWPDASFEGHVQAWLDAARLADDKWDHVLGTLWPAAQAHVARELALPDPRTIVFATSTHELVVRLLSCLPERPRIVTTDGEFHSFERQARRLEEDGLASVTRVPAEPFATLGERLVAAAAAARPTLVFFSHVLFGSGAVVRDLDGVVAAMPPDAVVVVDGYHGFLAVPTSLARVADRAFYLAGGYKYAMSGEGVCFAHVPTAFEVRPRNTGWFAAFGALDEAARGRVAFAPGAARLMGATFDPTGLYRFDAVMRWRADVGLTTEGTRRHAHALQERLVRGLDVLARPPVRASELVVPIDEAHRGQFLAFRTPEARALRARLAERHVVTDARDDRWRFGLGVYHDEGDVDALLARLDDLAVAG